MSAENPVYRFVSYYGDSLSGARKTKEGTPKNKQYVYEMNIIVNLFASLIERLLWEKYPEYIIVPVDEKTSRSCLYHLVTCSLDKRKEIWTIDGLMNCLAFYVNEDPDGKYVRVNFK